MESWEVCVEGACEPWRSVCGASRFQGREQGAAQERVRSRAESEEGLGRVVGKVI